MSLNADVDHRLELLKTAVIQFADTDFPRFRQWLDQQVPPGEPGNTLKQAAVGDCFAVFAVKLLAILGCELRRLGSSPVQRDFTHHPHDLFQHMN